MVTHDILVKVTIQFFDKVLPVDNSRLGAIRDIIKEANIEVKNFEVYGNGSEVYFDYYCQEPDYAYLDRMVETLTLGITKVYANEWIETEEGYYYDIEDENDSNN